VGAFSTSSLLAFVSALCVLRYWRRTGSRAGFMAMSAPGLTSGRREGGREGFSPGESNSHSFSYRTKGGDEGGSSPDPVL
jgi:hypothetical protein